MVSKWKIVFCVGNIEEKFENSITFTEEHVSRCVRNSSPGFSVTKEQIKKGLAVRVDESTVWPNVNTESEEWKTEVIVFGFTRLCTESITTDSRPEDQI